MINTCPVKLTKTIKQREQARHKNLKRKRIKKQNLIYTFLKFKQFHLYNYDPKIN